MLSCNFLFSKKSQAPQVFNENVFTLFAAPLVSAADNSPTDFEADVFSFLTLLVQLHMLDTIACVILWYVAYVTVLEMNKCGFKCCCRNGREMASNRQATGTMGDRKYHR